MKHLSLLRGINVGGRNKIRMADLKSLYERLGFGSVETYIQSGNVIFETKDRSRSGLKEKIEEAIVETFGFPVPVELRTHQELGDVIANCPFGAINPAADGTRVLVTFLAERPAADRISAIRQYVAAPEELVVNGREVYLRCPGGYGNSKLNNTFLERNLGVAATTRNWKSVHKLHALTA